MESGPVDGDRVYLVLLETSGNQQYIFGSNRLRENVGASELVRRVCTDWVHEEVPKFQDAHVLTTTSGRALIQARSENTAKNVVKGITERALREAPGLRIVGSFVASPTSGSLAPISDPLDKIFRELSRQNETVAASSTAAGRFPRHPLTRPCRSLALPAESSIRVGNQRFSVSAVTRTKLEAASKAQERLRNELHQSGSFADDLGDLEELTRLSDGTGWVAVVHADGNGVGQSFTSLGRWVRESLGDSAQGTEFNQRYLEAYWSLSGNLGTAATSALEHATAKVAAAVAKRARDDSSQSNRVPILPLVYGGDDITVVLDARYALVFVENLLAEFEKRSTNDVLPKMRELLNGATGLPQAFTMAAGIAVTKPHYPFSSAYRLAEELTDNAKRVTKAMNSRAGREASSVPSSLDFHLHSDSSVHSLESIRALRTSRDQHLWGGPYLVSSEGDKNVRSIEDFKDAMRSLYSSDERGVGRAPSHSSLHRIRGAVFRSLDFARAENSQLDQPLDPNLLGTDGDDSEHPGSSMLIDLIDAMDLWAEDSYEASHSVVKTRNVVQ